MSTRSDVTQLPPSTTMQNQSKEIGQVIGLKNDGTLVVRWTSLKNVMDKDLPTSVTASDAGGAGMMGSHNFRPGDMVFGRRSESDQHTWEVVGRQRQPSGGKDGDQIFTPPIGGHPKIGGFGVDVQEDETGHGIEGKNPIVNRHSKLEYEDVTGKGGAGPMAGFTLAHHKSNYKETKRSVFHHFVKPDYAGGGQGASGDDVKPAKWAQLPTIAFTSTQGGGGGSQSA